MQLSATVLACMHEVLGWILRQNFPESLADALQSHLLQNHSCWDPQPSCEALTQHKDCSCSHSIIISNSHPCVREACTGSKDHQCTPHLPRCARKQMTGQAPQEGGRWRKKCLLKTHLVLGQFGSGFSPFCTPKAPKPREKHPSAFLWVLLCLSDWLLRLKSQEDRCLLV